MTKPKQAIYQFSQQNCEAGSLTFHPKSMKEVLGGKGASLVEMCNAGMPVPPGFTIHTGICNEYRQLKAKQGPTPLNLAEFMTDLMKQVSVSMAVLEAEVGFPPLVSVRSGAPVSMPGMMDTILNVGLNDKNLHQWEERIGERPAWDSYRRLIQMLGHTAFGINDEHFENILKEYREASDYKTDAELPVTDLQLIVSDYKKLFEMEIGKPFPQKVAEQLQAAIVAVFDSWMNERAIEYRKINNISSDMGTAVTVQTMVFGNMGNTSGSGVLFTRDPSTGEKAIMAEYLVNAQGEDVVAGIRTPDKLNITGEHHDTGSWLWELEGLCAKLEKHYSDMVDVEFTVMDNKLYLLQSRVGKRSAAAAFKIAVDLVDEGVIKPGQALARLSVDQYKIMRRPIIDPKWNKPPNLTGLPACPGVAIGKPVFSAKDAVNCTEPCILVTHETTPDDIAGMNKAIGILTQTGGATSHAAVVARAMDKPCIVGCTDLDIGVMKKDKIKQISIDGSTGRVWIGIEAPVIDNSEHPSIERIKEWSFDMLDFAEQSSVDLGEVTRPYRIMASHWWGDMDVFEVIVEGLKEITPEARKLVTIDLKSPESFGVKADECLEFAFKKQTSQATASNIKFTGKNEMFAVKVCQRLLDTEGLEGISLLNFDVSATAIKELRKQGYSIPTTPTVIADLFQPCTIEPTEAFIQQIVGGTEAWTKLQELLKQAGYGGQSIPQAVPAEYAVFRALAS